MENKEFKKTVSELAKKSGFECLFGKWFKESHECILVLWLQKSNYSNIYYLNASIFVQGCFGIKYIKSKDLLKKGCEAFQCRPSHSCSSLFDLDYLIEDEKRRRDLDIFFAEVIVPFSTKVLTRTGIGELVSEGRLYLLPAVKKSLGW